MKNVGFVGLGTMGKPMAEHLLANGFRVTVFNRTKARAEELVSRGASVASTPAEAASDADVVITMVSDDAAIGEVYDGTEGLLAKARPGTTIIDCSTISADLARKLGERLTKASIRFLDAPVTGSKQAAESGTLVFMVGGDAAVIEEHRDVFEAMGNKIIHMGPHGSGAATKLAHNTMVAIHNVALAEAMAIAAAAGVDPKSFLEVVTAGAAYSKAAEIKGPKLLAGDWSVQFGLALMLKDLKLATGFADRLGVPTPMMSAAKSLFQTAQQSGLGTLDLSAVAQVYEQWINRTFHADQNNK
ncbi:3-hydroxyisobutyrate dehydrogenase [Cohnella kolymensis]|uniref:3-hydroxyisobutyrate dehydrogenase n=1 Tax=Cohnella kolymensis TaxID=1590652 RepID=A0ABR5A4I1_9BACL|nr:NAD(P)-dependent oxidoreductase [Cohnella kolymensis]KIL35900.1 3-hydroxyisobutyrate dehydrogenase [Cohnella kolymensis]